jgi:hypothetical protein
VWVNGVLHHEPGVLHHEQAALVRGVLLSRLSKNDFWKVFR